MIDQSQATSQQHKCPICKRVAAVDSRLFPFCSDRCKTVDLGKWANGEYVISRPVEQADLDEE